MSDNRRGIGTWIALFALLGLYFSFILTIAFAPSLFGRPIADGMVTSVGLLIGAAIIVICMVVAVVYTAVKNKSAAEPAPPS